MESNYVLLSTPTEEVPTVSKHLLLRTEDSNTFKQFVEKNQDFLVLEAVVVDEHTHPPATSMEKFVDSFKERIDQKRKNNEEATLDNLLEVLEAAREDAQKPGDSEGQEVACITFMAEADDSSCWYRTESKTEAEQMKSFLSDQGIAVYSGSLTVKVFAPAE